MQKVARQLGRYHILDRIAYGGMAEIFRALTFDDKGNARIVAIKQVLPHYAEDRDFIDMLVDEARLVSMLRHHNIVEIYEVGHVDGFYFLAMEHIWGKDLRAVIERCRAKGTRIPVELSAYLLSEALNGLDSAHRLLDALGNPAGLVHRDFSPSNVLISYKGDIKICDFGIAKATFSRRETEVGVIKGKVKYMSPEQAYGRKLDHRSDLFSAGSVLYEMLTNEPPFMATNEINLIMLVRDAQFIAPSKRIPELPEFLEKIIYRSMTKSRSARFQSAAEFRHSLSAYLRQRGLSDWRAELGRFMKYLYAEERTEERQGLSEYILDPTRIGPNLGQNLLADVLDRDALYTKFNPYPAKAINPNSDDPLLHDASTQLIEVPIGYEAKDIMGEGVPIEIDGHATLMLKVSDDENPADEEQTVLWSRLEEPAGPMLAEGPIPSTTDPLQTEPPTIVEPLQHTGPWGGDLGGSEVSTMPILTLDDDPTEEKRERPFIEAETIESVPKSAEAPPPPSRGKLLVDDLDEISTQITEPHQPLDDHSKDTQPTTVSTPKHDRRSTLKSTPRRDS